MPDPGRASGAPANAGDPGRAGGAPANAGDPDSLSGSSPDRYTLVTLIGTGGMAEVHLAVRRGPDGFEKLVVLKLIHEHLATQQAFVDLLLDEGRLSGMIKHPNVVEVYDSGVLAGRPFVAMEFLAGEPLLAVLRAGGDGKRLDPLSTARVIADTAEGLEAAHRLKSRDGKPLGLVHHDVSLGNVIVLDSGGVKLVDFGVAKPRSGARDTVLGKIAYMAPEKLTEGEEIDRRSDLWSLGCVAWEALTLTRLFRGDDDAETAQQVMTAEILLPSQVNPDVPPELDPIIMRALERDPERRYSTAKAFALDLEAVLRTRGYDRKNTAIARYMAETFAEHVTAREQLVHELRAGEASAAVIAAAFGDGVPKTPASGPEPPRLPRLATPLPIRQRPSAMEVRRGDPTWTGSHRAPSVMQRSSDSRAMPTLLLAALAIVTVIVLIVIVLAARDDRRPGVLVVPDAAVDPAPVMADAMIELDASIAIDARIDAGSTDVIAELDQIEMDPVLATRPKRRVDPRTPASAEALYAAGLDSFRRGDSKAALASLMAARRMNPSYAPTWYALGLVHEAVGNRSAAKSEYLRYLSLSPRAANAQQVRDRLNRL